MPSTITCRHVITLVSVGTYFLSDSQSSTNRKKIHLLLKPYIHSLTESPLHLGCHTGADYYLIQFYTTPRIPTVVLGSVVLSCLVTSWSHLLLGSEVKFSFLAQDLKTESSMLRVFLQCCIWREYCRRRCCLACQLQLVGEIWTSVGPAQLQV